MKHQTPNTKHQQTSNFQIANIAMRLYCRSGIWCLAIEIYLVFGVWSLVFQRERC